MRIVAMMLALAGLTACATAEGFVDDSEAVGEAIADEI